MNTRTLHRSLLLASFIFVVVAFLPSCASQKLFFGYYAYWLPVQTWQKGCGLSINDIPLKNYTHIIFSFLDFDQNGNVNLPDSPYDPTPDVVLTNLVKLKATNPSLKIMASIGGGGVSSSLWNVVMSDDGIRKNFISSALSFAKNYSLDGIDVDWEGIDTQSSGKIQIFFSEFRIATGNKFLITAATPAGSYWLNMYKPQNIINYVDYLLVMLYDYSGYSWSDTLSPLTPLYNTLSINNTINWYDYYSIPNEKIIFGFANYGASFTTENPKMGASNENHLPGIAGKCDNSPGWLTHQEIENLISNPPTSDFKLNWDASSLTPYITYSNQFITFDNVQSVNLKLDYFFQHNFSGGFIYETDYSHVLPDLIWDRFSKAK